MAEAAQPGSDPNCVDCNRDLCDKLRELIRDILYRSKPAGASNNELLGLQFRYGAQRYGKTPPISKGGDGGWESHNVKIEQQKKQLDKTIKKFEDNNCKDPPNGTYTFQQMDLPDPENWVGPEPGLQSADGVFLLAIPGGAAARAAGGLLKGLGGVLGGGGAVLAPSY